MKEHKRLADEQPEDGQMCDVRFYFPDASILQLGEMKWMKNAGFFYPGTRGVFSSDPERIWWRVKG